MRPVIIDCNNICHIQYHAFGGDLSYQDELTGVMWGFMARLFEMAKQFETNRFLFCWDSRKNYRVIDFPEYKANRHQERTQAEKESSQRVYAQFDKLRTEILPEIGFQNVYHRTGWEADDIIAVVLTSLVEGIDMGGAPPVVVSTDKDLYQLLDHCVVYRPLAKSKREVITYKLFRERYGVLPSQWPHVRALEGDVSDNIPGIHGVGTKSAIRFVQGGLGRTTKAYLTIMRDDSQAIVKRNLRLMKLPYARLSRMDQEFPVVQDERLSFDAFVKVCERYGFMSFLKTDKLEEWRELFRLVG